MAVDPISAAEWHALAGWGEAVWALGCVVRPRDPDEVAAILRRAGEEGRQVTLRGAGRSYGDAALPADRLVVDLCALRRVLAFDEEQGTITVEPGVTIERLWRTTLPAGWWPAVVPGTMRATVGGCVAMNVHGKNNLARGTFGEHVDALDIVLADGTRRRVGPERDGDLFRAVVGGAGLLAAVVAVRLRLTRILSGRLAVRGVARGSLPAVHEEVGARAADSAYSVGWIDAFHRRGRGVVHSARHLSVDDDPDGADWLRLEAQELPARVLGVVPRRLVAPLMQPLARPAGMALVNAAKYLASALRGEHRFRQSHAAFHFLLDHVPGWKSIYAPGGLIQHQSIVPAEAAATVHDRLLRSCREAGIVPWLGVVKRHRPDGFLLSHAVDGYSLALDFPVTGQRERLWRLCAELDRVVLAAGGRFYLAKDLTASPGALEAAYPGLARFRELKRELDPAGTLASALAERLGLVTAAPDA